jgi:transcriptional regulator with XRE-family HTH domain
MQTIDIPSRLKQIREQRRLTQDQVANGIGKKRGTYQAYEENRADPPVPVLFKLAEFYDLHSLDQLLGITPAPNSLGGDLYHLYQAAKPVNKQIVDLALNYNC